MIQVKNIFYDFNEKDDYFIDDISFEIQKGEIFGLLGPSGAGKSTIQRIMIGLYRIQKGNVFYDRKSIKVMNSNFYNNIGVSFELPNFFNKLTGYENLKYHAGLFDISTESPLHLLDKVGLKDDAHKKVSEYSKGMKQRLMIARALINKPKILFLDEPLSGLDPVLSNQIKSIINEKKSEGCSIFLTTHNMHVADELCDYIAFINEGKIIALDTPKNLKLKYGEKSVNVEYVDHNSVKNEIFFLKNTNDTIALNSIIKSKEIITIHSNEASLEQVFIKLTGRRLA